MSCEYFSMFVISYCLQGRVDSPERATEMLQTQ